MDNIKLFAKNEKECKILIQAVRIYRKDIGIGFSIKKCAGNGAREVNGNIKLRKDQSAQRNGNTWEYWKRIQVEIKEKIEKEYLRITRKVLETKEFSRNLIKRINT